LTSGEVQALRAAVVKRRPQQSREKPPRPPPRRRTPRLSSGATTRAMRTVSCAARPLRGAASPRGERFR
jgi:hypothetical protein